MKKLLFLLLYGSSLHTAVSQVLDFSCPDTVKSGAEFFITNTSTGYPTGFNFTFSFDEGDDVSTGGMVGDVSKVFYLEGARSIQVSDGLNSVAKEIFVRSLGDDCIEEFPANCENLVSNPSFDEGLGIVNNPAQIFKACAWAQYPTHIGTPDYYRYNAVMAGVVDMSPPSCSWLQQNFNAPVLGGTQEGFGGIMVIHDRYWNNERVNYREYMVQRMQSPLLSGHTYTVSMYVTLAEISNCASSFQAAFMSYLPSAGGQHTPIPVSAVPLSNMVTLNPASLPNPVVSTADNVWVKVEATYTHTGPDAVYMIIGNFKNNAGSNLVTGLTPAIPYDPAHSTPNDLIAYYAIDDVEVFESGGCCNADVVIQNDPLLGYSNVTSYSIPAYATVYVNGTLMIDDNRIWDHVTVTFAPGARVNVRTNKTLEIINSTSLRGCTDLWDGIYATESNAYIRMLDSRMSDAINGLVYGKCNTAIVMRSNFFNNLNSIKLTDCLATQLTTITGNRFSKLGLIMGATYGSDNPHSGITVSNVKNVAIGGPNVADKNEYFYHNNCINAQNSSVSIRNQWSHNVLVNTIDMKPYTGWAVYVANAANQPLAKCNIYDNYFRNGANGIWTLGKLETRITNNDILYTIIKNINFGILLKENTPVAPYTGSGTTSQQQIVRNNRVTNALIGIYSLNNYLTTTLITTNTVKNNYTVANSKGIWMINGNPGMTMCNTPATYTNRIEYNHVDRFKTGLENTNVNCLRLYLNTVKLLGPYNDQYHGIWNTGCRGESVTNNTVTGNYTDWKSIGIRIATSPRSAVTCNNIYTTGLAMWFHSDCDLSDVRGNFMSGYMAGIQLSGTGIIGRQKQPFVSGINLAMLNQNRWDKTAIGSTGDELLVDGVYGYDLTPEPFYFLQADPNGQTNSTVNFQSAFSPAGTLPLPVITFPATQVDPTQVCGGRSMEEEMRDAFFPVLSLPVVEGVYKEQFGFIYRMNRYRELLEWSMQHPMLEMTGEQQQFRDSMDAGYAGYLHLLDQSLIRNDLAAAEKYLSSLSPNSELTFMDKRGNELILSERKRIAAGESGGISGEKLDELTAIARLCLYQYGEIVIKARAFLWSYVDPQLQLSNECETDHAQGITSSGLPVEHTALQVFPNPASETIFVRPAGEGSVRITMFDLQGRRVYSADGNGMLRIGVAGWNPGVYLYTVVTEDGKEFSGKVVVLR